VSNLRCDSVFFLFSLIPKKGNVKYVYTTLMYIDTLLSGAIRVMKESNLTKNIILKTTIKDAFAHIFKRDFMFVSPQTHCTTVMMFLYPAVMCYIDGIVVINDNKPVGRIGSKDVLGYIIKNGFRKFQKSVAADLIEHDEYIAETKTVEDLLTIIKNTKFSFVPIVDKDEHVITTVSIRDFLPLVAALDLPIPIISIANKLLVVSDQLTVKNALSIMLDNKIRRLGIEKKDDEVPSIDDKIILTVHNNDGNISIIDDRIILEHMCFNINDPRCLNTKLEKLARENSVRITSQLTIPETAELLSGKERCCALPNNHIVTPWDIVIKALA